MPGLSSTICCQLSLAAESSLHCITVASHPCYGPQEYPPHGHYLCRAVSWEQGQLFSAYPHSFPSLVGTRPHLHQVVQAEETGVLQSCDKHRQHHLSASHTDLHTQRILERCAVPCPPTQLLTCFWQMAC
ncbi:hypothetical protein E2C01_027938 [Portunus trituberculatus]|uniref:Uncharacterized protein n=1 Tax=Portunus trituberculatus TaxID=210409 RepID=A0A5B7EMW6_PORTR|nr:hypothetical protein [Portunus trituberculatus]